MASVFVSRIDSLVDKMLQNRADRDQDQGRKNEILDLQGKVAVANSKMVYQEFISLFGVN